MQGVERTGAALRPPLASARRCAGGRIGHGSPSFRPDQRSVGSGAVGGPAGREERTRDPAARRHPNGGSGRSRAGSRSAVRHRVTPRGSAHRRRTHVPTGPPDGREARCGLVQRLPSVPAPVPSQNRCHWMRERAYLVVLHRRVRPEAPGTPGSIRRAA
ncbi:hypothetical protein Cus16_0716 [Curtobacterium sp. ER1/6]|nr:hypothetical protein Cus16_0716 [Curtobacterium sp. ER1/6]